MALTQWLILLAFGSLGLGGPLGSSVTFSSATELMARDVTCSPQNMAVDVVSADVNIESDGLYNVSQSRYDCTKKQALDSNGHCSAPLPGVPSKAGCLAYCEVRLTMEYGQEVPFHIGTCDENTTCTIANQEQVTVTNTYQINTGISFKPRKRRDLSATTFHARDEAADEATELEVTFNAGASYSYSKAVTYGVTSGQQKTLGNNQCGYWTFIPYMME